MQTHPHDTIARIGSALAAAGKTLGTAESCTGGALSARFTALSGASDFFLGGVVSYSNEIKVNILGVSAETIKKHGAVSRECVQEMAAGARKVLGADYAIATTGIAGPTGGSAEKPVGTVWIAVASPEGVDARKFRFSGDRKANIRAFTNAAAEYFTEMFAV